MNYKEKQIKKIIWIVFGVVSFVSVLIFLLTSATFPFTVLPKDELAMAYTMPLIIYCATAFVGGVSFMSYKGEFYQNTNNDNVYLMKSDDDQKPAMRTKRIILVGMLIYFWVSLCGIATDIKVLYFRNDEFSKLLTYDSYLANFEFFIRITVLCFSSAVLYIAFLVDYMYQIQVKYWKKSFENIKMTSYQDCINALGSVPVEVKFRDRVKYFFKILTFDSSVFKEDEKKQMQLERKTSLEKKQERKRLKEERRKKRIENLTIREDYTWNNKE